LIEPELLAMRDDYENMHPAVVNATPHSSELDAARALRERSQELLIDLLSTDLDLAFTFLETAKITTSQDRARCVIENARVALESIRHFAGRIEDANARKGIHDRANELENAILACSKLTQHLGLQQ
jgi:hypothetical protein